MKKLGELSCISKEKGNFVEEETRVTLVICITEAKEPVVLEQSSNKVNLRTYHQSQTQQGLTALITRVAEKAEQAINLVEDPTLEQSKLSCEPKSKEHIDR